MRASEFLNSSANTSPDAFIRRLYRRILGNQTPVQSLVNTEVNTLGGTQAATWYSRYLEFVEYRDAWPIVIKPNDRFIEDAIQLILGFKGSDKDVDNWLAAIPCVGRAAYYQALQPPAQFRDAQAQGRFVSRLFSVLLRRDATPAEYTATLRALGTTPAAWATMYEQFVDSRQYKKANTSRTVYQHGNQPLLAGKPTLRDLLEGRARFQTYGSGPVEATKVVFLDGDEAFHPRPPSERPRTYPTDVQHRYSALVVQRGSNGRYYAVARKVYDV